MFLYLPKPLVGVHHLQPADAGACAAGFALLAVGGRRLGDYLADRAGATRVLALCFAGASVLAAALSVGYGAALSVGYGKMVPLTACSLLLAIAFGLATGAVFKLVAREFPGEVGAVTGVVGRSPRSGATSSGS